MRFGGGGAWVEVPDSPSLDITDELTITFWICPTRYTGEWTRYVAKHWHVHAAPWTAYGIWEQAGSDGRTGLILSLDGGKEVRCGQDVTPQKPLKQWTHLAVTYDDGVVTFYLDGKQAGPQEWIPGGEPVKLERNLLIGEDAEMGSDEQLHGNADDILILGRVLSAQDIATLSEKGASVLFGLPVVEREGEKEQ